MQQMLVILSLGLLLACGTAKAGPALAPAVGTPFASAIGPFGGFSGLPFAAYTGGLVPSPSLATIPAPLAISSSQRLDYFNQFNAAFAPGSPAARLVATPAGIATLPFPAAAPTRFFAPGSAAAISPFFF